MPLYIAKSGDLDRCYRCLTDWLTDSQCKDRATQLLTKYKSGALVTQIRYSLCLLFGSKEIWFCHQDIYGTGALLHTMSHWRSGCHFLPSLKTIAAASSLLCTLSLPSDNVPHCPTTWKRREETNLNNRWMSRIFIHEKTFPVPLLHCGCVKK